MNSKSPKVGGLRGQKPESASPERFYELKVPKVGGLRGQNLKA
jgi:hypothetical protein